MKYCTEHRAFCPTSKYSHSVCHPQHTLSPFRRGWQLITYLQPHSDSFSSFPETIGSRIGLYLYLTLWRLPWWGEERNTRTSKYQSSRMTK